LIVSLSLAYLILRELGLRARFALLLTAIVGFFPLTTFVSSYVQADNMTLVMVLASCYLARRVKGDFGSGRLLALLSLALAGLCLTKYHPFIPVFLAVAGLLVAENIAAKRFGWTVLLGALVAPVLLGLAVHVWITYGSDPSLVFSNTSTAHLQLTQAMARGKFAAAEYLVQGAGFAFSNFYLNGHTALTGSTFNSFWGDFGWTDTPLIIFTPWKTNIIRNCISAVCVVVFALTVMRIIQVFWRLGRVARRGRRIRAICILFSNPLINAYFAFTVIMFGLFMVARRSFGPQGRNWFGFILAIFLSATWYAPGALRRHTPKILGGRKLACYLSHVLLAGLALYCILGSFYAIRSIRDRYYNVHAVPPRYSLNVPVSGCRGVVERILGVEAILPHAGDADRSCQPSGSSTRPLDRSADRNRSGFR
ncbi:MAG TPA: hypothetical protein VI756_09355, partial [Blastocatellia bacterium]